MGGNIKMKKINRFIPALSVLLVIFGCNITSQDQTFGNSHTAYLKGFVKPVAGEYINYHSPHPDAKSALLVRSLKREQFIEWKTQAIPADYDKDYATFIWIFGIDVNKESHDFDLLINGEKWFTFSNPKNTRKKQWSIKKKDGTELRFKATEIDKYDDFMGYAFLKIPISKFQKGKPLLLQVKGESAGSRAWYMTFKYTIESKIVLSAEQVIIRKENKNYQTIRCEISHFGGPEKVTISTSENRIQAKLDLGYNYFQFPVPAVKEPKEINIQITITGKLEKEGKYLLKPVKKKDLYLLHHSHVDIGYTHIQTEVEKMHWSFLEQAIELANKTKDYPSGSRFKWNVEAMWAVSSYLKNAPPEKQKQLIEAIHKGWIELDGLYANELTGLCRSEELMHLFDAGRRISSKCGVSLDAAMITDIPGYTWGLVPALAHNGVKYLSIGTNSSHRIGYILDEWSDKPFYWVSPSGEEKILCWVAGKGYSWFHTGLGFTKLKKHLNEQQIIDYLNELEASDYPYDMIPFRYNIGSDNGPPDPLLSERVKAWNEKYISPEIIISTTSEAFSKFEKKYGDKLPRVQGDFTGYWEDGAASSARETAINRNAAERLVQAEILWAMNSPSSYPFEKFEEAWKNVLLFNEHTWGSWNSIKEPEDDFTLQQWKIKQSFAKEAENLSKELINDAITIKEDKSKNYSVFDVYNTNSWPRTDLVLLPREKCAEGNKVKDEKGKIIASQRLSTGELAFLAKDVPALGAKRFFIFKNESDIPWKIRVEKNKLSNGIVSLEIDEKTGAVSSLRKNGIPSDLANFKNEIGLNYYFYVKGRNPEKRMPCGKVKITVKENGPLIASLLIESDAPGCNKLIREVRIIDGLDRVDIINKIDKQKNYEKESVHFAFPFNVPKGEMHMDIAWGMFRPEFDQLPGSCKNYFSVQRWVDISNDDFGLTWATVDAPLVEVGDITVDPISYGWIKHLKPSQTLYSYVMNNYWETNYLAAQEGLTTFRYSIYPHGKFDAGNAERFGIERSQPLITVPGSKSIPIHSSLFEISSKKVIVTSIQPIEDGKAFIIRLYNSGESPEEVNIKWGSLNPDKVYLSSPYKIKGKEIKGAFNMPGFGIRTILVEI